MGQYQEWLLAQEIDRRLKAEAEALETEILYLKDRITTLEQSVPEAENMIVQALLAYSHAQAENLEALEHDKSNTQEQIPWNGLPRLETPPVVEAEPAPTSLSKPPEKERLPEGVLAVLEERRQAVPALSLLRERELAAEFADHPVDVETRRLNENIQRWFERWHRESINMPQPEEVQDGQ